MWVKVAQATVCVTRLTKSVNVTPTGLARTATRGTAPGTLMTAIAEVGGVMLYEFE